MDPDDKQVLEVIAKIAPLLNQRTLVTTLAAFEPGPVRDAVAAEFRRLRPDLQA